MELAKFFFLSCISPSPPLLLGICFPWSCTISQWSCVYQVTENLSSTSYPSWLKEETEKSAVTWIRKSGQFSPEAYGKNERLWRTETMISMFCSVPRIPQDSSVSFLTHSIYEQLSRWSAFSTNIGQTHKLPCFHALGKVLPSYSMQRSGGKIPELGINKLTFHSWIWSLLKILLATNGKLNTNLLKQWTHLSYEESDSSRIIKTATLWHHQSLCSLCKSSSASLYFPYPLSKLL